MLTLTLTREYDKHIPLMKPIDLTEQLKPYKRGWVAIDKNHNVVAHAQTLTELSEKIKNRKNIYLVPAAPTYKGFVT